MTSVTEPSAEHQVDIHTTAGKLADLKKRTEETLHPVGEAAVEKVHAKGKLTARERILALLDEGSFVELDALAKHRSTNFGLESNRPLGDGVITGYGTIDGRDAAPPPRPGPRPPRKARRPSVQAGGNRGGRRGRIWEKSRHWSSQRRVSDMEASVVSSRRPGAPLRSMFTLPT